MSAESTASRGVPIMQRFRAWRGSRPFWAGLLTILGGVPIAYLPYGDMRLGNMTLALATTAGAGALIIGVLLITLGLTMWFQPIVRVFAGVAAIVLALVSIPVSNFGGLFIGFLLSMTGGGLSVSWAPGKPVEETDDAQHEASPEASEEAHPAYDTETQAVVAAGVPEQRDGEQQVTDTTIDANGGRNSAG
ncbi:MULTISPECIES: DUF6114 domain-containing protein [Streptomyces]|uniref:Putative membrane protein n=1 Tax=Streptomyces venezuelae (strain ATCC 10712 / CBS 650.69 / DSM 40230 / JCM 4526 / NBRC 13096 / PD 04745) TaxID=953739 RepID=F2R3Y7_STRVP|nr:DUF6114 domain-containing protein [Streptomyces venezuelae]APE23977.1 hypothetical protein vnz_25075 [Streptomyces venezuelae]QES01346.1 hypothetical protein DEJ43_25450 [Streptomyces venezuelae ATCC 10712]CCA58359.1 putative membrane protein [Streptomyces venezuelae ATCC 10712]